MPGSAARYPQQPPRGLAEGEDLSDRHVEICRKGSVNTSEHGGRVALVPPTLVFGTAHGELTFMHHFLDCPS